MNRVHALIQGSDRTAAELGDPTSEPRSKLGVTLQDRTFWQVPLTRKKKCESLTS